MTRYKNNHKIIYLILFYAEFMRLIFNDNLYYIIIYYTVRNNIYDFLLHNFCNIYGIYVHEI